VKPASHLKNLDSAIAAVMGFLAIYLFTRYSGVGISYDSVMYASTANNLQAHGSLVAFDKLPLACFPVFYPFFLGLIQFITNVDPFRAGTVINGILFASVIFLSGWIIEKFSSYQKIYKWFILVGVLVSPALIEIYTYLWSETLFVLEILLFIMAYRYYLQSHTLKWLVVAATVTAIACVTRYVGVTIIATGCLLLLLDSALSISKKAGHILLFAGISMSLLLGNMVKNKLATSFSTGYATPSVTSFSKNLYYFGTVMCDWGNLKTGKYLYPYSIAIACILLLTLIIVFFCKAYQHKISYQVVMIAFIPIFSLFVIITSSIHKIDQINNRLLSPIYIPLLIVSTSWIPDTLTKIKANFKVIITGLVIIMMFAFAYSNLKADLQRYHYEYNYGIPGYNSDDWNKTEIVTWLRKNKNTFNRQIPIYTDAHEAVYAYTNLSSQLVPYAFNSDEIKKFYNKKHFYVIWFNSLYNTGLINLPDILKNTKLTKVETFKEGAVYLYDEPVKQP